MRAYQLAVGMLMAAWFVLFSMHSDWVPSCIFTCWAQWTWVKYAVTQQGLF